MASVLRHGHTDKPFMDRVPLPSPLLSRLREGAGGIEFMAQRQTAGVVEFKALNLLATTECRKEKGVTAGVGEV